MNDELLSNRVRAAADALNAAMREACEAGLRVVISESGTYQFARTASGEVHVFGGPSIRVEVSRPL